MNKVDWLLLIKLVWWMDNGTSRVNFMSISLSLNCSARGWFIGMSIWSYSKGCWKFRSKAKKSSIFILPKQHTLHIIFSGFCFMHHSWCASSVWKKRMENWKHFSNDQMGSCYSPGKYWIVGWFYDWQNKEERDIWVKWWRIKLAHWSH